MDYFNIQTDIMRELNKLFGKKILFSLFLLLASCAKSFGNKSVSIGGKEVQVFYLEKEVEWDDESDVWNI